MHAPLSQPSEYAAKQTMTLITPKGQRLWGPRPAFCCSGSGCGRRSLSQKSSAYS